MSETKDVEANQQDLEAKTKVPCPTGGDDSLCADFPIVDIYLLEVH